VAILAAFPESAEAYIGPGAGFAVLGSFAVVFVTMVLAGVSILAWPFRMVWRAIRHRRPSRPLVKRLIVVGFDGQDTRLTERMMAEGRLPNFSKLADSGCYSRLKTTYPSITPVAWSSFSTQHLRFPRPRPPNLSAASVVDRDRLGGPSAQDRQVADPPRQA
jgi:hypothetical protein